ncbi:MAG: hypothetical protein ACI9T7_001366 [Oleiphilaceae bacterium]|jgi:hypothetical protein
MFDSILALGRIWILAGALFDLGRTLKVWRYSNQLSFRHTFASQKMSSKPTGQRELWTPYWATSIGGEI